MPDNENQRRLKRQVYEAAEALAGLFDFSTPPAIGLDLDGTIDEAPDFFRILSKVWPGRVYVITYRSDQKKAERDVIRHWIRFDEVILVSSFKEKAKVIAENGISIYFDDQDEILQHVPEGVTVIKIRNGGNYDYEERKWWYSDETGKMA